MYKRKIFSRRKILINRKVDLLVQVLKKISEIKVLKRRMSFTVSFGKRGKKRMSQQAGEEGSFVCLFIACGQKRRKG